MTVLVIILDKHDLITVFYTGECAAFDVGLVGRESLFHFGAEVGIAFDKFWGERAEEAEQVVRNENLAVAIRAGTDADGRRWNAPGNLFTEGRWHTFEDHGKYAGLSQCLGIVQESLSFGRFFPLDFIAAHGMNALWR